MVEIKKYIDMAAAEQLVSNIKAEDAKTLQAAKDFATGLATNYEAAGSVSTAKQELTEAINGVQGEVDALETALGEEVARAKVAEEANAAAAKQAQDEVDALELVVKNIQENAYDDTEIRNLISGLDTNKADKTQVSTDIAAAVKAEEDARKEAVQAVQGEVDALEQTHATDKAALENRITEEIKTVNDGIADTMSDWSLQLMQAVSQEVNALKDEDTRIVGLVEAEAARAAGVEAGIDERLEKVEVFFELAEGEKLDEAKDTLIEIQKLIDADAELADTMLKDISDNKQAITDMDAAYKLADTTLQGNIDALSGTVDTKANQAVLEEAVEALEGADSAMDARISAIEDKFGAEGEGTVTDMIADAKAEAIEEASADATTKADAAKDAAIAKANELDEAMNARVEALEAVDHEHANKALLDTYTQTEENLADAVVKKHAHENKEVLDGITAELIAKWNASEQNAKDHADGLNTTMTSKVDGIEARVKANEDAIILKASQADLSALTERVTTAEAGVAENKAAIASFVAIGSDEVIAMFA